MSKENVGQVERALRESIERYRSIFDASTDAFLVFDLEGTIVEANESACAMHGYAYGEMIGLTGREIVEASHYYQFEQFKRDVPQTGTFHLESADIRKDGTAFPIEVRGRSFVYNGRPHLLAVVQDITDRKRATTERELLRSVIEQSAEMIVITDPNGLMQYVNPAFEKMSGYSRDEALGKNFKLLKKGLRSSEVKSIVMDAIARQDVWHGELTNYRKDGTPFTVEASLSPIQDENGAVVNYVATQRDTTREKELEQQFLQAQKMESIGRLAGGIAHDLNNMLLVIMANAELSLRRMSPDQAYYQELTGIQAAAQRSANLTKQLLAFARQQPIKPSVLRMNDNLDTMLSMLRRLMGESIQLDWLPGQALWPVYVDPSQLDQILANLCVNARDAIGGVGGVTIRTENVHVDDNAGVAPGDYVLLTVSDSGCGMDERLQEKVFEPFFTTKDVGKGTGLGLSTVYGIVTQNHGFVKLTSEVGVGTTFRIYWPRYRGEEGVEPVESGSSEAPSARGSETILLVEDEPAVRTIAKEVLSERGYTVLTAAGGEEAMEVVGTHGDEIKLLITDVVMPVMDGRELADRVRRALPDVLCLFMSGYPADVLAERDLSKSSVDFIQKPFRPAALKQAVRQLLDSRLALSVSRVSSHGP